MTCLHTNLIRSFTQEKGLMFLWEEDSAMRMMRTMRMVMTKTCVHRSPEGKPCEEEGDYLCFVLLFCVHYRFPWKFLNILLCFGGVCISATSSASPEQKEEDKAEQEHQRKKRFMCLLHCFCFFYFVVENNKYTAGEFIFFLREKMSVCEREKECVYLSIYYYV